MYDFFNEHFNDAITLYFDTRYLRPAQRLAVALHATLEYLNNAFIMTNLGLQVSGKMRKGKKRLNMKKSYYNYVMYRPLKLTDYWEL